MTISGTTTLLGVVGWPIAHSFSPKMHNAAARAAGIDYVYVALPVQPNAVGDGVRGLAALGFRGVNITVPHKQTVIPFLHEIDEAARVIGAVNTIVFEDGKAYGTNTDWSGVLADLDGYGVALNGRDCLMLGAGGSARAVAYGLLRRGATVHVLARRQAQADELVTTLRKMMGGNRPIVAHSLNQLSQLSLIAPLIVNTTPLGMYPNIDTSIWPDDLAFPQGAFVYDLVYNPAETKLVSQAKAQNIAAFSGLGMLLHQGAQGFKLWTGVEPDLNVMRQAISF